MHTAARVIFLKHPSDHVTLLFSDYSGAPCIDSRINDDHLRSLKHLHNLASALLCDITS